VKREKLAQQLPVRVLAVYGLTTDDGCLVQSVYRLAVTTLAFSFKTSPRCSISLEFRTKYWASQGENTFLWKA